MLSDRLTHQPAMAIAAALQAGRKVCVFPLLAANIIPGGRFYLKTGLRPVAHGPVSVPPTRLSHCPDDQRIPVMPAEVLWLYSFRTTPRRMSPRTARSRPCSANSPASPTWNCRMFALFHLWFRMTIRAGRQNVCRDACLCPIGAVMRLSVNGFSSWGKRLRNQTPPNRHIRNLSSASHVEKLWLLVCCH